MDKVSLPTFHSVHIYSPSDIYMYEFFLPSHCKWLQIGEKRVAAAAQKGNTYSLGLLFGKKKAS